MLPPLVVFWLAAPLGHDSAPAEIERWAAERGYRPVPAAAASSPVYDDAVVHEIETLLEGARSAAQEAPATFERLDHLLATHPDLPQGAWWAAERYVLEAQSRARGAEHDLAVERELIERAREIEGPRATGVGTEVTVSVVVPTPQQALRWSGARPRDELLVDGKGASAGSQLEPGSHHVQLFHSQRRVWAGWVALGSPPLLRIADPISPCSELDLWGTERGARGPVAPTGVRCQAWAVANTRAGEIELAFCRGDQCGAWERQGVPSERAANADVTAERSRLPPWVTWGAIGVGAAASTLLVLWQTGAFDRSTPETQFVFTGPTAGALRF